MSAQAGTSSPKPQLTSPVGSLRLFWNSWKGHVWHVRVNKRALLRPTHFVSVTFSSFFLFCLTGPVSNQEDQQQRPEWQVNCGGAVPLSFPRLSPRWGGGYSNSRTLANPSSALKYARRTPAFWHADRSAPHLRHAVMGSVGKIILQI